MQPVGVHVVGAEQVAHAALLGVGRAQPLAAFARRPARAVMGDQLDRSHLVKADHDPVVGFGSIQRQDALGLGDEIGIRAPLPRPGALMRQARGSQRLAQRLLAVLDPQAGQVLSQFGQRPARQRDALRVGAGARDRDDAIALRGRRLLRAPAPIIRVQRREALLVKRVDDLAHVRLVGACHRRDLRRRHPHRRRQQDDRPLALGLILGLLGDLLEPRALLGRQLADKHLRRTHRHLHDR